MICSNCHAIGAKRYAYGIAPIRLTTLCDGCAGHLSDLGMDLRMERRADPLRADRQPKPEWLRRLKPRDMTGSIA